MENIPPYFGIRLFQCTPCVTLLRVDDVIYWGPYLVGRPNEHCPIFRVNRGGYLFDLFNSHFEEIWAEHSIDPPAS